MKLRIISNSIGQLYEGLAFDPASQQLAWVDILKDRIFLATVERGVYKERNIRLPSACNFLESDLIVTARREVIWLDSSSLDIKRIVPIPSRNKNLVTNEAKFDPWGALWVGMMDREKGKYPGEVWKMDKQGDWHLFSTDIWIPNTFLWDLLRDRFYFGDSGRGEIYVMPASSGLSYASRKVFLRKEISPGVPDGSTLLTETGSILNCRWDGGRIIEVSSAGLLEREVFVPWRRPTDIISLEDGSFVVSSGAAGDRFSEGESGAVFTMNF